MSDSSFASDIPRLLELAREFGDREFTILGEGNVSCRAGQDTFHVKASGSTLETLS